MPTDMLSAGAVHYVAMDEANGIIPKKGDKYRNKYFVILGVDSNGNAFGGVIFNSDSNRRVPLQHWLYHFPISGHSYSFLKHNSFIDCSTLMTVQVSALSKTTFRGRLSVEHLDSVLTSVRECGTIPAFKLKRYGII